MNWVDAWGLSPSDKKSGATYPSFSNAFNFDFGFDYSQMAVENFKNGHPLAGAILTIDAAAELTYNAVASYGVASKLSKSLPAATAFVQTKAGELRIFIQSGAVQQTVRGWFGKRGSKLDWSIVSKKGETRFQHVMKHGSNNLQKQNHGIFYGDPIKNTNNAWLNKGKIKPITQGGSDLYIIPYKNTGYTAGYAGQGTNLNYITIVTKSGTNQIITAFPSGSGIPLKF